jgi:hypothetical protein
VKIDQPYYLTRRQIIIGEVINFHICPALGGYHFRFISGVIAVVIIIAVFVPIRWFWCGRRWIWLVAVGPQSSKKFAKQFGCHCLRYVLVPKVFIFIYEVFKFFFVLVGWLLMN